MKKITAIIAITLLAALLFTGCDFIPMEKDFSQYGFTFSIAGDVIDKDSNMNGFAQFDTKYGSITFTKMLLDLGFSEASIAKSCESKEAVEGKGTIYFFAADEDGNVVTHFFTKDADGTTWMVSCSTPEANYSKLMITLFYKSIEFVTAE